MSSQSPERGQADRARPTSAVDLSPPVVPNLPRRAVPGAKEVGRNTVGDAALPRPFDADRARPRRPSEPLPGAVGPWSLRHRRSRRHDLLAAARPARRRGREPDGGAGRRPAEARAARARPRDRAGWRRQRDRLRRRIGDGGSRYPRVAPRGARARPERPLADGLRRPARPRSGPALELHPDPSADPDRLRDAPPRRRAGRRRRGRRRRLGGRERRDRGGGARRGAPLVAPRGHPERRRSRVAGAGAIRDHDGRRPGREPRQLPGRALHPAPLRVDRRGRDLLDRDAGGGGDVARGGGACDRGDRSSGARDGGSRQAADPAVRASRPAPDGRRGGRRRRQRPRFSSRSSSGTTSRTRSSRSGSCSRASSPMRP